MTAPDISFVILEYFSLEELKKCISSIRKSTGPLGYEIVVSSNSVYDRNKQEVIIQDFDDVKWVFNEKNGGFACGMNNGLSIAEGRYLAIVNSDSRLITGLAEMISFMDEHEEVGVIGPQIIDNGGLIQDSCRLYLNVPRFLERQLRRVILRDKNLHEKNFDYSKVQSVDWVIGAFLVVRRQAYEITNGFDTGYFMYAEDLDWCTRIREKGFEIIYFPRMKVLYRGTRHARRLNKYTWMFIRSHVRYWKKFGSFSGYPERMRTREY
jgi:GT2 family glycosyltransferase